MDVPISGHCDPHFERVREAFTANFAERGEVGAAVCIQVHGQTVVDLVGGWADEARTRPWAADTVTNVWSTTKMMTSIIGLSITNLCQPSILRLSQEAVSLCNKAPQYRFRLTSCSSVR